MGVRQVPFSDIVLAADLATRAVDTVVGFIPAALILTALVTGLRSWEYGKGRFRG